MAVSANLFSQGETELFGGCIHDLSQEKRSQEALEESEEMLRVIFNGTYDGILLHAPDGAILDFNESFLRMYALSREEALPLTVGEISSPAMSMETAASLWEKVRAGGPQLFEWRARRPSDGSEFDVEVFLRKVRVGGRETILANLRDITARKAMERTVRESEERLRYVVHATRDAIYDWNIVEGSYWHNDAYQSLYSPEQPVEGDIGWWEKQLHPDDRQRVLQSLDYALRQGDRFWSDEYRFRRFDGSFATVVDRGFILYGESGEAVRMIGAMTDVTEARKALAEAETSRVKVAAILKSVPDGLIVTDLSDRVVVMNDAAEAILGIRFEEASDRHIDSILAADERLRRQIVAVRSGEEEKTVSDWDRGGEGARRVIQGLTTAMRDSRKGRTGTITLLRDMTREREIDRIKNEFISTAAHELRTPLTTVIGYLELLQEEERFPPEERREFLRLVFEKSETLDRIIRDLLDLSRVQAGKLVAVEKVVQDVTTLLRKSVTAYRAITQKHLFELDIPAEPIELCLDPGKIGQVLDNLLSNAVKFSPAGGTIRVVGRHTDGTFTVTVADEGIGMGAEEVARIFDKFYRADASNTAVSGLGLGMSIVKNIVEAHGGKIWVDSAPGRGTEVHFSLPVQDVRQECARRMS